MSTRSFQLVPFENADAFAGMRLAGRLSRNKTAISVIYELVGNISEIVFPEVQPYPRRRIGLWENTCFELFAGVKGRPEYWEFNLSPSGDWNVFHFLGYRNQDFQHRLIVCDVVDALPFTTHKKPNRFELELKCDLSPLITETDGLEIGISAVLKLEKHSRFGYWALHHAHANKPDFHNRMSFVLNI